MNTSNYNSVPVPATDSSDGFLGSSRKRLIAIAVAGSMVAASVVGAHSFIETVKTNKLVSTLKKDGSNADEKYFQGDYQDKPVTAVKIDRPMQAYEAAASMATQGNVLNVQDVITAEERGNDVAAGDVLVVPSSLVEPNAPGQIAPIPEDKNIHIG